MILIARSKETASGQGYPGVLFIPPVEQYMDSYSFSLVPPQPLPNIKTYISMVALTSEIGNIRINGKYLDMTKTNMF